MKSHIGKLVAAALQQLAAEGILDASAIKAPVIERARDLAHGDFATNAAMVNAKAAGMKPRDLAQKLVAALPQDELVTGVDIVQEQLRVARGRKLRYSQDDVRLHGWAIECRINAEDPYNDYMPSTGIITTSQLPTGPGVRVDTGVFPGFEITPYYDPMISKLICYGNTRGEAVLRMRRALEEYRIAGVKTNVPFHQHMMDSHRFLSGQFDTKFVEERFSMSSREAPHALEAAILATLAAHEQSQRAGQIVDSGTDAINNWKWYSRWDRLRR